MSTPSERSSHWQGLKWGPPKSRGGLVLCPCAATRSGPVQTTRSPLPRVSLHGQGRWARGGRLHVFAPSIPTTTTTGSSKRGHQRCRCSLSRIRQHIRLSCARSPSPSPIIGAARRIWVLARRIWADSRGGCKARRSILGEEVPHVGRRC